MTWPIKSQAARNEQEARYSNLDDFLRSLDMEVRIEAAIPFSIPRIAQLTQKTNQMNMTTRRYTDSQIQSFANGSNYGVYSVSSKDRFGDDGIIGVFILRFEKGECVIDTFLLSCRVIGRGIEQLMVAFIADLADIRGVQTLVAEFLPTSKNQPAAGFYEKIGFKRSTDTLFLADLLVTSFPYPGHINLLGDFPTSGAER